MQRKENCSDLKRLDATEDMDRAEDDIVSFLLFQSHIRTIPQPKDARSLPSLHACSLSLCRCEKNSKGHHILCLYRLRWLSLREHLVLMCNDSSNYCKGYD